jgi:predicted transcriptional regulator
MHNNEELALYEEVKDYMKFLVTSDVRSKILISLYERPKCLADLRNDIKFSSSTILHGMYLLEDRNLVFRESGNYCLSQMGKIAVLKLINLMKACSAMKKSEGLFLGHEINVIPRPLLECIECLESGRIMGASSQDLMKHYNMLLENVLKANTIYFVSSVFYPLFLDILQKSHDLDITLNFILTRDVWGTILENRRDLLENLVPSSKIKLWEIKDDLKLSLVIADEFIALGLFSVDGVYDSNQFFMGEGHEVLDWSQRLFKHYLKHATKLKL